MPSDDVVSAWELFNKMFYLGQEIVLIDDRDGVAVGKLTGIGDEACELADMSGTRTMYDWDRIRFISHDGFPVRTLFGADGSKYIEKIDTTDIVAGIRRTLTLVRCLQCRKVLDRSKTNVFNECPDCAEKQRVQAARFGDPFEITNVQARLINEGNSSSAYWDSPFEETLVMKAKDGACGMLTDISTLYVMEMST